MPNLKPIFRDLQRVAQIQSHATTVLVIKIGPYIDRNKSKIEST